MLTSGNEPGVVEDELHVNVLCGADDGGHVAGLWTTEVHAHLTELHVGKPCLDFLEGLVQHVVVERSNHNIDLLLGKLLNHGLADPCHEQKECWVGEVQDREMHTHAHAHAHTRTHAHAHTRTRTHTHTQM